MQKTTKKRKRKIIFRFATAIAFVLALGAFAVSAKDYYKVNDHQTELVDECGDCTYVKNNNCLEDALFVPTRTCSEWDKFRSYHPSCADLEESYHDDQKCYSNDVWWYNACGDRQDKKEDCGHSYCDTGGDVDKYCSGGDVWGRYDYLNRGCSGGGCYSDWDYNSCGNEKLEDCGSNYCTSWSGWSCSGSSTRERTRTCYNRGCSNGSCYSRPYTDTQTDNCPSGQECSGGVCEKSAEWVCACATGNYTTAIHYCEEDGGTVIGREHRDCGGCCGYWVEHSGGWVEPGQACVLCEY